MNDDTKSTRKQFTTDNANHNPDNSCWDPEFEVILQSFENGADIKIIDKELEVDRYGRIRNTYTNSDLRITETTGVSYGDFSDDSIVALEKTTIPNEDTINDEKLEKKQRDILMNIMLLEYGVPQKCGKEREALISTIISKYIEYAKCYAQHIGLSLDDTATKCCDNPLTLNVNNLSLDDKIKIRLDKYKKVLGFTAVWVWAEKAAGAEYKIYIGCR